MTPSVAEPQSATYHEILSQAEAWAQALSLVTAQAEALTALWQQEAYQGVIFTGCGSTYYLSLAAATLFQELTGRPARAVPAGELVLYPAAAYPAGGPILLVAVSRSAETSETIQAVRAFTAREAGAVITIENYGDQPLASLGALNLAIPAGQEKSVAQTRSFASMYVATVALAAVCAGRSDLLQAMSALPALGGQLLSTYQAQIESRGRDLSLDRFYFLGSGPRYGLACEVNLKMKEMTLTHSEPFHFLEFRHGPIAMVGPTALVVGLLSEANRSHEAAVLHEVKQLGGRLLTLSETDADVVLASRLPEAIRNVLYLPLLQLLAYYRAVAKGLNPDRPNNLESVVRLDWGS
jgi:glucosamine--fructose-6-phosphate aminotransferase (isomerizing)